MGCHDAAFQFWPNFRYLAIALENWEIPMWSSSTGLGAAFDITYVSDWTKLLVSIGGVIFGLDSIPMVNLFLHSFKIVCAGIFFYLFLKRVSLEDFPSIIGAVLYSFSGIVIVRGAWIHYTTEVFFLALLLWALERYFQEKKYALLITSICFLFCHRGVYYVVLYSLFLLVYAVGRYYCIREDNRLKFSLYLLHCFEIWCVSLLISSVFVIPNLFQTLNSGRGGETAEALQNILSFVFAPPSWDRIVAIFDTFFSPAMNNVWNSSYYVLIGLDGPMFYCGIIVLFLFPQAFRIKEQQVKRLLYAVSTLILAYMLLPGVTYIFNFGISDKYFKLSSLWMVAFIISVSMLALNEIVNKQLSISKKIITIEFISISCIFIYVEFINERYSVNTLMKSAVVALGFWGLWFLLLRLYKQIPNRTWKFVVLGCVCLELFFSSYGVVRDGQYAFSKAILEADQGYSGPYSDAIRFIKQYDDDTKDYYRIAKDFYLSPLMIYKSAEFPTEAMYYKYNGLEYLDSYALKSNIAFYEKMGIEIGKNRTFFPENRNVLENFLGVKYYVSKGMLPRNYIKINQFDGFEVGINNYNLPLGFTYDKYMKNEYFNILNKEEKDLSLFYAYVPSQQMKMAEKQSLFEPSFPQISDSTSDFSQISWQQGCSNIEQLAPDCIKMKAEELGAKIVYSLNNILGKSITFKIKGEEDGQGNLLWYDGTRWHKKAFEISTISNQITIAFSNSEIQALSFEPTDENGKIVDEEYLIEEIKLEYIDMQKIDTILKNGYSERTKEVLDITNVSQNSIEGNITVKGDKMLFVSVPYDRGWKIKVDGERVLPECINYGFIGIPVGEGHHIIKMNYVMPGIRLGLVLTILGIVALIFTKRKRICSK